jgi:hypothetical protein
VLPSGGFAPYEFSLDNVNYQTSNKFTGLSDGASVTVYVKDLVDCLVSASLTINFPPANVPVGDCDFIYVAPESQGGNAANIGTPDCPTTLPASIGYINANRNYIRVLQGTYTYNEPIVLASNVVIEGGYTKVGNDWVKQTATSTLNFNEAYQSPATGIGYYAGIVSSGSSNWTLKDLNINVQMRGAVGQHDGRGRSL